MELTGMFTLSITIKSISKFSPMSTYSLRGINLLQKA